MATLRTDDHGQSTTPKCTKRQDFRSPANTQTPLTGGVRQPTPEFVAYSLAWSAEDEDPPQLRRANHLSQFYDFINDLAYARVSLASGHGTVRVLASVWKEESFELVATPAEQ